MPDAGCGQQEFFERISAPCSCPRPCVRVPDSLAAWRRRQTVSPRTHNSPALQLWPPSTALLAQPLACSTISGCDGIFVHKRASALFENGIKTVDLFTPPGEPSRLASEIRLIAETHGLVAVTAELTDCPIIIRAAEETMRIEEDQQRRTCVSASTQFSLVPAQSMKDRPTEHSQRADQPGKNPGSHLANIEGTAGIPHLKAALSPYRLDCTQIRAVRKTGEIDR